MADNIITPEKIVAEAYKLVGVPFLHYGRSTLGLDCAGLPYLILTRLGKTIPRADGNKYGPLWWRDDPDARQKERLLNGYINIGFEIVDEPYIGGLVLFRLFSDKAPANHSGVIISEEKFIHASFSDDMGESKVKPEIMRKAYLKRVAYYMRYKDCYYG